MTPADILVACVSESEGDVEAALLAYEHIIENKLDVALAFDEDKHPRANNGRFAHLGESRHVKAELKDVDLAKVHLYQEPYLPPQMRMNGPAATAENSDVFGHMEVKKHVHAKALAKALLERHEALLKHKLVPSAEHKTVYHKLNLPELEDANTVAEHIEAGNTKASKLADKLVEARKLTWSIPAESADQHNASTNAMSREWIELSKGLKQLEHVHLHLRHMAALDEFMDREPIKQYSTSTALWRKEGKIRTPTRAREYAPIRPSEFRALSAAFAHGIKNRKAQDVLSRSLKAAKGLTAEARADLAKALERGPAESGKAVVDFVDKYRVQLMQLLTATQLASLLEGAREVAAKVPNLGAGLPDDLPRPTFPAADGPHLETIQEATRALAEKNVLSRAGYETLDAQARAKAFTVARVDAEETLTKIRDALVENVKEGADYATFKSKVLGAVDEGTFMSPAHMETVLRTNVQSAFSDGQMTVMQHPVVKSGFPYSAYDAIHDDRARENHLALEKLGIQKTNIYRNDDPVFQMFRPPWDYNDRCSWSPMTVRQAAEAGIAEAQEWLRTGVEPANKAFVPMPPFQPPEGFQREPLSVQLSMQPMATFAFDEDKHPRANNGRFAHLGESRQVKAHPGHLKAAHTKLYIEAQGGGDFHQNRGMASRAEHTQELRKIRNRVANRTKLDNSGATEANSALFLSDIGDARRRAMMKAVLERHELLLKHGYLPVTDYEHEALKNYGDLVGIKEVLPLVKDAEDFDEVHRTHLQHESNAYEAYGEAREHALMKGRANSKYRELEKAAYLHAKREMRLYALKAHLRHMHSLDEYLDREPHKMMFGMVGDEWHGPVPPSDEWEEIQPGPRGGRRWRRNGEAEPEQADGREGAADAGSDGRISRSMAGKASGASGPDAPQAGEAADQPTRAEVARAASLAKAGYVNRRLGNYSSYFRDKGQSTVADFLDMVQEHVADVGVKGALAALEEEKSGELTSEVQYKGTGYFEDNEDTQFLKDYLDKAGIILATSEPSTSAPVIASAPNKGGKVKETNLNTKLDESKLLPGLESTEDINVVCGGKVTHFTPKVVSKLNKKYGRGQWIVKSYGDESYAGFGIFFPQRIEQIQYEAAGTLWSVGQKLRGHGYMLARDEAGTVIGLRRARGKDVVRFNTSEFANLGSKLVKRWGKQAAIAAPNEFGAKLPGTSEEQLLTDYGVRIRRDEAGKMIGVLDADGSEVNFDTPEYKELHEREDAVGYAIDRAVAWEGQKGEVGFMVQPAFEAIGVSELDRALGYTWETSHEGRVHITTQNGEASVIPYATLAHRSDTMPAVFYNDDIRDMEKAVKEAIEGLPESERAGQVYAPDVMKTTEGWRVVELNASVETGSSAWLEQNPFVIDAFVSHTVGRDPVHVKFVRDLLRGKVTAKRRIESLSSAKFAFDEHEHPRANNGRFAHLGESRHVKVKPENLELAHRHLDRDRFSRERRIDGPLRSSVNSDLFGHIDVQGPGALRAFKKALLQNHESLLKRGIILTSPEMRAQPEEEVIRYWDRHRLKPHEVEDLSKVNSRLAEVRARRAKLRVLAKAEATKSPDSDAAAQSYRHLSQVESTVEWLKVIQQHLRHMHSLEERMDREPEKMYEPLGPHRHKEGKLNVPTRIREYDPIRPSEFRFAFDEHEHPRDKEGKFTSGGGAVRTVKHGSLRVKYSTHRSKQIDGPKLNLQNYRQQDNHSCGFVAALTIARLFNKDTSAKEVLKAVRPTIDGGVNRKSLISSLNSLGIEAEYKKDLTIGKLRRYVERGVPVIISVWPDEWLSDHWTIVQGFDKERVYLTNHRSLPIRQLKKQWSDMDMRGKGGSAEGLVCRKKGNVALAAWEEDKHPRANNGRFAHLGESRHAKAEHEHVRKARQLLSKAHRNVSTINGPKATPENSDIFGHKSFTSPKMTDALKQLLLKKHEFYLEYGYMPVDGEEFDELSDEVDMPPTKLRIMPKRDWENLPSIAEAAAEAAEARAKVAAELRAHDAQMQTVPNESLTTEQLQAYHTLGAKLQASHADAYRLEGIRQHLRHMHSLEERMDREPEKMYEPHGPHRHKEGKLNVPTRVREYDPITPSEFRRPSGVNNGRFAHLGESKEVKAKKPKFDIAHRMLDLERAYPRTAAKLEGPSATAHNSDLFGPNAELDHDTAQGYAKAILENHEMLLQHGYVPYNISNRRHNRNGTTHFEFRLSHRLPKAHLEDIDKVQEAITELIVEREGLWSALQSARQTDLHSTEARQLEHRFHLNHAQLEQLQHINQHLRHMASLEERVDREPTKFGAGKSVSNLPPMETGPKVPITVREHDPITPSEFRVPGKKEPFHVVEAARKQLAQHQHRTAIANKAVSAGDLKLSGMSHHERMVQHEVGATLVQWGRGSRESALEFCRQLEAGEFRHVPDVLLHSTKRVVFTEQSSSFDEHWAKQLGVPSFTSYADAGDGEIVAYGGGGLTDETLSHECAHNLAQRMWGSFTPPKDSEYGQAQTEEPPVSEYGATAPEEDFAEACALYVSRGPSYMRRQFPKKAKALENLFNA